jgi:hypothetical protein
VVLGRNPSPLQPWKCVETQRVLGGVRSTDPKELGFEVAIPSSMGLTWPNSIESRWRVLNILIFIIIKSVTIKNSIICVLHILIFIIIKTMNIKSSFSCGINILIFIIIKSITHKNSIIGAQILLFYYHE